MDVTIITIISSKQYIDVFSRAELGEQINSEFHAFILSERRNKFVKVCWPNCSSGKNKQTNPRNIGPSGRTLGETVWAHAVHSNIWNTRPEVSGTDTAGLPFLEKN